MATFKRFEEIISWKEARNLNNTIGSMIDSGRLRFNFKLISQIEGAAGSIMDNIAEGFERSGNKEFIQFLFIAKGSCGELRSQLYRALDRKYITEKEFELITLQTIQVGFLIQKLINYLKESNFKGSKYHNQSD